MPERNAIPAAAPGGPIVVAIGGGHGLSASLRAIRRYAGSITGIVSVADDGGSSGRLREVMPDMPAPGDVRRCLGALADEGEAFGRILEHRFGEGDLAGHALGNLILVALARELGSFSAAIDEVASRVGAVGRVLPATNEPVSLEGIAGPSGTDRLEHRSDAVRRVVGQVAVQNMDGLRALRLQPANPSSSPEVAAAILGADQVVIGPGSLFTSVLAAAIVPAVRDALQQTGAQRVFVANLGALEPETNGFSVADEVAALTEHRVPLDVVLTDEGRPWTSTVPAIRSMIRSVVAGQGTAHDPELLAAALAELASMPSDTET